LPITRASALRPPQSPKLTSDGSVGNGLTPAVLTSLKSPVRARSAPITSLTDCGCEESPAMGVIAIGTLAPAAGRDVDGELGVGDEWEKGQQPR